MLGWPLGIAYNNTQITYRNTSLKSSTSKENHVCDLLTDGTSNKTAFKSSDVSLGKLKDAKLKTEVDEK